MRRWVEALGAADEVVVCDVYLAREDADPAVTGALVAAAVPAAAGARRLRARTSPTSPAALVARARPGDLVLTLGAGDVTEVGPRVLALLAVRGDGLTADPAGSRSRAVDQATPRSRKRFARRQWRRRWLAWRYLLVGSLLVAGAARRRGLRASGSRRGSTSRRSTSAARRPSAPTTSGRAPRIDDGEPLARVDLDAPSARVGVAGGRQGRST